MSSRLKLFYKTIVRDNLGRPTATLRQAFGRSDVATTDGPTADGVTREAVADRELGFSQELMHLDLIRRSLPAGFLGFFRGLLDSGARTVNDEMKLAAARALAAAVTPGELSAEHIIPSVFIKAVAPAVAEGVARTAHETGVARRHRQREVAPIW